MTGAMRKGRRLGQGMTEYVIVVGLVAILMVGAVKALQAVLNRTYGKVVNQVEDIGVDIEAGGGTPDPATLAAMPAHVRANFAARTCRHPRADKIDPTTKVCKLCNRQT